jgi:hypothetical protein
MTTDTAGTGERSTIVKKAKRRSTIRTDDSKPSKPAVPAPSRAEAGDAGTEIPTYRGPSKADEAAPPRTGRPARPDKPPFEARTAPRPRGRKKKIEFGDQQAKGTGGAGRSSAEGEQYIRLRIRVRNGELTVIDSHLVDGPLGQVTGFPGGNAYEVTLGDRLLHAGALPDLGVQRSFANPQGPPEQRGHYITDRSGYEFTARLPAAEVTRDTIDQIAVRLHRVKEEAHTDRLEPTPLGRQFERELRPVAELVGLPDSALPEQIEERGARTPSV